MKLDYSLQTPEERKELVEKILEENPNPTAAYQEILADYLVLPMEKEERKKRKLLTENRMMTINKRETSLDGLISSLESGEDGVYQLINENKHTILSPKISITKKDLEEIPFLKQVTEAIAFWEKQLQKAEGKKAFTIKKTIIELRKDQYIIKQAYRKPIAMSQLTKSDNAPSIDDEVMLGLDQLPIATGVTILNPEIVVQVLTTYSKLKEIAEGNYRADLWYFMQAFDKVADQALKPYPLYERLVEYKIDGLSNHDIQKKLDDEFGLKHSVEYISAHWRKKIPKLIASAAEDEWLDWYYLNVEKGKYKRCSCCGQIKLAHNKYFSKNKTAKDGYYSLCKECRNARNRKKGDK